MLLNAHRQAGLNPRGDCGPCVIGSVANKSVLQVYEEVFGEIKDGLCYDDVIKSLEHYNIEYCAELPINELRSHPRWKQFGEPGWFNWNSWFNNAMSKSSKGWVGLSQVCFNGNAPIEEHTNHWVIIQKAEDAGNEFFDDKKVFISCPTKGEFVLQAKHFLKNYGGYNTIWVNPVKK